MKLVKEYITHIDVYNILQGIFTEVPIDFNSLFYEYYWLCKLVVNPWIDISQEEETRLIQARYYLDVLNEFILWDKLTIVDSDSMEVKVVYTTNKRLKGLLKLK